MRPCCWKYSSVSVAGERPHLALTVDLHALEGRAGARCECDDVGPIPQQTARRLACDASISRIVTRGRSEPLDVGRRTAVVAPALRRAVVVRDRHCRFPGCDRPQSWCDAHHVRHWADGGPTALSNLTLLCRRHHRLVHEGGFGMAMRRGSPVFTRPDEALKLFYRLVEGLGLITTREVGELTRTAAIVKTKDTEEIEEYTIKHLSSFHGLAMSFSKPERLLTSVELLVAWSVTDLENYFDKKYKKRTVGKEKILDYGKLPTGRQLIAVLDGNGNVRSVRFTKAK